MDRPRPAKTPKAAEKRAPRARSKAPTANARPRRGAVPPPDDNEHESNAEVELSQEEEFADEDDEIEQLTPRRNMPARPRQTRTQRQPASSTADTAAMTAPPPAWPLRQASGYAASFDAVRFEPPQSAPQGSEASSRRSRSPVKSIGDLLFAEKPVEHVPLDPRQLPPDMHPLLTELGDIADSPRVIPSNIFSEVVTEAESLHYFQRIKEEHMCLADVTQDTKTALRELQSLCAIVRESKRAATGSYSEAHWNGRVHSPMLVTAIEADQQADDMAIQVFDTTTARIVPACIPRHTNGANIQAKMVDFCMVLSSPVFKDIARTAAAPQVEKPPKGRGKRKPAQGSASSSAATSSISGVDSVSEAGSGVGGGDSAATKEVKLPETISHSEYYPLRLKPIAVSIETKQPDTSGNKAKAQLSVWLMAHLLRLHQLTGTATPVPLTFPLISIIGPQWQFSFAVERENDIVVFEFIRVEGTGSLHGCYRILALLRVLRRWCIEEFQPRLMQLLGS
ncbi:hypothetical protein GCG54_00015357 [Colletotrichum gloeosporioides]|uniref:PD-(D/E)XK nuclease-like domain-containing protein n=1 Tax=Colletotrichum gloeosporioides TaxID=474922 RepID=A0A8H4C8E1_COLGL|nr:uncharacterized protein GCG54_00015357 [Colletotrichum gloeosporioides]KAF3799165.1 hypothetical protein GCG54_00015357 [Colletotrichum gloeosporioides]